MLGDGDVVAAAKGGVIAALVVSNGHGGCADKYLNQGNYLVVDHQDGTSALYLHLERGFSTSVGADGQPLREGQAVKQGQPIGIADHSGKTCGIGPAGQPTPPGPHLHFQVERTSGHSCTDLTAKGHRLSWPYCQSIPMRFDDIGKDGEDLAPPYA
jgi:murein DD-endopeptidase MepM/ murein hydrolase activator NlpD